MSSPENDEHRLKPAVFKVLFDRFYPAVCRRLIGLLGNRAAAEDVAQETFIKLYLTPPRESANLNGWLAKVATNLAYNQLRSENSRRHRESRAGRQWDTAAEEGPEDALEREEEASFTRRVLELLPERDRACLLLKFSGMSYAELAEALGVKESSIGTLLARARARFKTEYTRLKE
ncbi:RNA polymerase sigma factor SigX [Pelotomaculum isophthalicicum JI]|uniref:RNA polymerase sigma factor SigX n=1 Tax=Pelotomaculum isophthalicicum JI TaxID=947010 RepID=A0A9X4H3E0_9FIRM|nr:RNA polymerase sigma factor SigX [Pelotomaculum isophthalicicum]MDF9407953.1 RNA polymerase sigma factor SigX [Pelotomaculum isophthalicicum JI]